MANNIIEEIKLHSGNLIDDDFEPRPQLGYLLAAALREYGNTEHARGIGSKCDRHSRAWVCSGCGLEREARARSAALKETQEIIWKHLGDAPTTRQILLSCIVDEIRRLKDAK